MEKYYSKGELNNRFPKASYSYWSSNNKNNNTSGAAAAAAVWDCGSTLYDSYELNSFKRQIDSAIANSPRTLSMPHLQERRRFSLHHLSGEVASSSSSSSSSSSKSFKISRPFQKLLSFVFKSYNNNNKPTINTTTLASNYFQKGEKYSKEGLYVVYDNNNNKSDHPVLSTIPELPEIEIMGGGGLSPEITSLVNKSASARFPPTTSIGISCA